MTSIRVAAVGDLHCTKTSAGAFQAIFARLADQADVLALCGDLTDYGLPEEARILAKELATVRIPMVAVLGNHDYEAGSPDEVVAILSDAGVQILDGSACEILGVAFAGTKGFAGGFGERALQAWGEDATKRFARAAVDEALKLESALARLRTEGRVALLHYAPVRGTVEGEPLEIYPFLGSSRLEEPLNRYPLDAVFHGHVHRGQLEGRTSSGVPVYNVALPLLRRTQPDGPGFRVIQVSGAAARNGSGAAPALARDGAAVRQETL